MQKDDPSSLESNDHWESIWETKHGKFDYYYCFYINIVAIAGILFIFNFTRESLNIASGSTLVRWLTGRPRLLFFWALVQCPPLFTEFRKCNLHMKSKGESERARAFKISRQNHPQLYKHTHTCALLGKEQRRTTVRREGKCSSLQRRLCITLCAERFLREGLWRLCAIKEEFLPYFGPEELRVCCDWWKCKTWEIWLNPKIY